MLICLCGFIFLKTFLLLIIFYIEAKKDLNRRLVRELEKRDEVFIYGELPPLPRMRGADQRD